MIQRKALDKFVMIFLYICVVLMLASCDATTYRLGNYHESVVGSFTKDQKMLSEVRRVALVAFNGKSLSSASGEMIRPLVDLAYQQALEEMQAQSTLEFLPVEEVVINDVYQRVRIVPDLQISSPVDGLGDLDLASDDLDIGSLCQALQVDALLLVRLEFDWEFPTFNAVTMKTKRHVMLVSPPYAKMIWETKSSTWKENLVPVPANPMLMVRNPSSDEWTVIVESASEALYVRALGGAPIYFLSENAKKTR